MSGIAGVALDQLMQTKAGRWTLLAAVVSGLVLGAVFVDGETARHAEAIERAEAAMQLWLKECGKPIDECAAAWDGSYTLREIYREKVSVSRPR